MPALMDTPQSALLHVDGIQCLNKYLVYMCKHTFFFLIRNMSIMRLFFIYILVIILLSVNKIIYIYILKYF